jgi:DNA invertase Pin-like site-specific DNA recombinase
VVIISVELGANCDPFMLHLYAALAEKERALISARTKASLAAKKAEGNPQKRPAATAPMRADRWPIASGAAATRLRFPMLAAAR